MLERQRLLLDEIERAFDGVELGEGVGLRETVVVDHYGGEEERRAARALDEKPDWRKLITDPELKTTAGVGGPCFFDSLGFRFHLPAYLWLLVTEFEASGWDSRETILFCLTHFTGFDQGRIYNYPGGECDVLIHILQRLAILDPAQRASVRHVLMYVRDQFEEERGMLSDAIDGYWSTDGSFRDPHLDDPNYAVDFS